AASALTGALSLAPGVSDEFAVELLRRAVAFLKEEPDAKDAEGLRDQAHLLERAWVLAGDIKRPELGKDLVTRSAAWLEARHKERRMDLAGGVADQALTT